VIEHHFSYGVATDAVVCTYLDEAQSFYSWKYAKQDGVENTGRRCVDIFCGWMICPDGYYTKSTKEIPADRLK